MRNGDFKLMMWKWLSHLIDVPIVRTSTSQNPELQLALSRGQWKLTTQGAIYSYGIYYSNFRDSFRILHKQLEDAGNCLVLGFGMGSVVLLLEREFKRPWTILAVEHDKTIIELFTKYQQASLESKVSFLELDAAHLPQSTQDSYDLICVDLFEDQFVPDFAQSTSYLLHLKSMLSVKGTLIFNRLAENEKDLKQNELFFSRAFSVVFPQAAILKLAANWMFVSHQTGTKHRNSV